MRVHLFWLIMVVFAVVLLVDAPLKSIRELAGGKTVESASAETRQPVGGLAVIIDFAARREGRRVAVLIDDWLYCYPPTGDVFLVPSGYETDFASIPSIARRVVNPFGNHAEAAVIHDWLYAIGEAGARRNADQIFRYAMKEQGVNIVRRTAMYRTVRMGGNEAYGRAEEWRFKNPSSLQSMPAPLDKPDRAAIDTIDCARLPVELFRLIEEYGTAGASEQPIESEL